MQSLIPLAEAIGARLKERGETVAVSESSTGGLISAALLQAGADGLGKRYQALHRAILTL